MPSPERTFHRACVVFAPEDKTGDVPSSPVEPNNTEHNLTEDVFLDPGHFFSGLLESPIGDRGEAGENVWEPTMGVPPASGGTPSPKQPNKESEHTLSREEAKQVITLYFSRKWKRRSEEKEFLGTLQEVARLNRLYPGLREEVYEEIKKAIKTTDSHPGDG
jgi:hypothetical protein